LILTLPIPPSVNAAYANVPFIGRVKTKAYRRWLKQADAYYMTQKRRLIPVTGHCIVTVRLPEAMRGDVSNRIKIAEDYLVSRELTSDDTNNVRVAAERAAHVPIGFCEIEVRPV
jgi:hypothetical protein